MLSDAVVVALISAFVSLVVSLLATGLRNRTDLIKLQREQEHGYAKALFEKRVECYPELYGYLSGYAKIIRNKQYSLDSLATFKLNLDNWNNQHSLFFTKDTARFSSKFRHLLGQILDSSRGASLTADDWNELRRLVGSFEGLLKGEIGILSVRPVGNATEYDNSIKLVDDLISRWKQ